MSTSKTTYQILTEAQELIRDPARWTQGAYARDAAGNPVGVRSDRAVCWCSAGAIKKVGGDGVYARMLMEILQECAIVHTNDDRGHDTVMALFDRVREKAKLICEATP